MIHTDAVVKGFRGSLLCLIAILLVAARSVPQQEETNQAVASSARNFKFEVFDYPETQDDPVRFTRPRAINDAGVIVGDIDRYREGRQGFIYENGKFTLLTGPLFNGQFTSAIAINNRGQILIGQDPDGTGTPVRYFLYDMAQRTMLPVGHFVQIAGAPNRVRLALITGLNDQEQFVGNFGLGNRQYAGYGTLSLGPPGSKALPADLGNFSRIECPDARNMNATSISNLGFISGSCEPSPREHVRSGFLYRNGSVTLFEVPGADLTRGNGVNDVGAIVGEYTLKPLHAGLWPSTGVAYDGLQFIPVLASHGDPTHGSLSIALAINNRGQIVGIDGDGNGNHGFVASARAGNPLRLSAGGR